VFYHDIIINTLHVTEHIMVGVLHRPYDWQ